MTDALRAGIGAALALGLTGLFLLKPDVDLQTGLYLIAPLGASAVLIFAAPNSPLAQPWSVVVGNTLAAVIGMTAALLIPQTVLAAAVAVGVAIAVLALLRALHPPAGAIALMAAMAPDVAGAMGYRFVLTPVLAGSLVMVVLGMVYHAVTNRRYPFRQFGEASKHKTSDRNPVERLGLSEEDLISILERHRQSFNMGVEDLSRLIGAAQMTAAAHAGGETVAKDVMSTGLITVLPTTQLIEVAQIFARHKFTSLPVIDAQGGYVGVIYQYHVVAGLAAQHQDRSGSPLVAADLMAERVPVAGPLTPMGALLPMVADGDIDGVPVLQGGKLVGIVTRTDLLAAVARELARQNPNRPRAMG